MSYKVIHDEGPDFVFPSTIIIDDECSSNFVDIHVTCKNYLCPKEINFRIETDDGLSKRFYVAKCADDEEIGKNHVKI